MSDTGPQHYGIQAPFLLITSRFDAWDEKCRETVDCKHVFRSGRGRWGHTEHTRLVWGRVLITGIWYSFGDW